MEKKLYVGGLPYSTTNEELQAEFSKAGNVVSAEVVFDRVTNRSKGFGFVEMATEDEAAKAIEMFNGTEFGGRTISVSEARPRQPRDNNSRRF